MATTGYGNYAGFIARSNSRKVEATTIELVLVGQSMGAPVEHLFDQSLTVTGVIPFNPIANEKYLVKGKLSQHYSAIWIEDINGKICSDIIETFGKDKAKSDAFKENLFSQKNDLSPKTRNEIFTQITTGESSNYILDKLGAPNNITHRNANFFIHKPAYSTYTYNDLGAIQLTGNPDGELFVKKVTPYTSKSALENSANKGLLSNIDGQTLQTMAKSLYRQNITETQSLDTIATKIWVERLNENKHMVDGAAWLCKILQKSNDPRYKEILHQVSIQASSSKLRKYAENAYISLPASDSEQFQFSDDSVIQSSENSPNSGIQTKS